MLLILTCAYLIQVFSSKRLLWGSDAPYFLDFGEYSASVSAMSTWGVWAGLSEEERGDLMHGTAERLFGEWG